MDGKLKTRNGNNDSEKVKNKKKRKKSKDHESSKFEQVVTDGIDKIEKKRKRPKNEDKDINGSIHSLEAEIGPIKKKKGQIADADQFVKTYSTPTIKLSKKSSISGNSTPIIKTTSAPVEFVSKIDDKKKKTPKLTKLKKIAAAKEPLVTLGTPSTKSSVKKIKDKDKDKFKQTTLSESFSKKNSKTDRKIEISPKKRPEPTLTTSKLSKIVERTSSLEDSQPTKSSSKGASKTKLKDKPTSKKRADIQTPNLPKSQKTKSKLKSESKKANSKKKKGDNEMDVVEKANNNNEQKYNFGPTIDISDNSSDSRELKIDDDDSSELSSEYDSSDSEHIMKSIKSFNKKGASKSVGKKDEPPPPKVKPKIYSSSEDEVDFKDDENDDDDDNDDEKDEQKNVDSPTDGEHLPKAVADAEDVFFNGWTKADVQQLLSRMQIEIPRNDNIKASTRVKQLNWEKVKFGLYTAEHCLEKWKGIEKKIRGYRILEELLHDAQKWLEHPWTDFYKGNKKKQQRHPEMPKKPLTSYMIFYLKKKDKIAKEFPSISMTDLSKVIAERFNKLAPNKKSKYNEMALAMKEEYVDKMKKFAESHPAEMARMYNNSGRSRRTPSLMTMPGWSGGYKPVPPLKLFLDDKTKQHCTDPTVNLPELFAEYKEKWKSMTLKKKLPWIRWAHEAEMKYLDELKAYQAENPAFVIPKHKSVLLKEERNILDKIQGKPDKPPPSAYLLFSSVMLKDPNLRKLTPKERMQETARLWKNVPKVDKDGYSEKVKHLADIYKLEYASWLESLPEDKRKEEMANVPKRKTKSTYRLTKAKKARTDSKAEKPSLTLEDVLKMEPPPPPKNAYAMFCQEYKDYPEKEIKKSWDALLEAPKVKLEAAVAKQKQQYILDFRNFLKSLSPEDLKMYSAHKASQNTKIDVKLSDSEDSNEEDDEEEEDDDEDGEEEDDEEEDEPVVKKDKVQNAKMLVNTTKPNEKKDIGVEESSDDSDEEREVKRDEVKKSSSSSSSSESSSDDDEEGSSSSSSSSSSSEEDNDAF